MSEGTLTAVASAVGRWTIGGAADSPAEWRAAVEEDPEDAQLRLLALASQYLDVCVASEPAEPPRSLPDLPRLAAPTVPAELRPLVRRLLASSQAGLRDQTVAFAAGRGWALHPADWLPRSGSAEVPTLYAPWLDWVAAGTGTQSAPAGSVGDPVTAETWDSFGPAARLAALSVLREADPRAARELIAVRFAAESADHRVALARVLATRLSEDDADFLESLDADRAPRVRAAIGALLARLGRGSASAEQAAELAGFLTVEKAGLLRRGVVIVPRTLKTGAQSARRAELFENLDLAAVAEALSVTEDLLVGGWRWGSDADADARFARMAARTAPDDLVGAIAVAVEGDVPGQFAVVAAILERLAPARRARLARRVLDHREGRFGLALHVAGVGGDLDAPIDTAVGSALITEIRNPEAKPGDGAEELVALGLLASRTGAAATLDRLRREGVLAADPRLDMLRLNAALENRGASR